MKKEHIEIMNKIEDAADKLISEGGRAISWHIREDTGIPTNKVNYWMKRIIEQKDKYQFTTSKYSTIYTLKILNP